MFPKNNDPFSYWGSPYNNFSAGDSDWSKLFGTPKAPKDTQEDTAPDDETNELTEQCRDVLGFFRVLQTIDAAKNVSALDWMRVYRKMHITEDEQKLLAQEFLTFTQDKIRKDMHGQPGAAIANALMDMVADELTKELKKNR